MTLKFARLGTAGNEQPAVIAQDADGTEKYFSLTALTNDIDGGFLASDGIERTREALNKGELPEISPEGLRIGAPVARPGAVVAIGLNYTAHAAESGATPPEVPVVFLKPTNTIAGPFDAAPIPPSSEKYDWEVELAIVIGREASYLSSVSEAEGCIAGYAVANDLSERDYQIPGAAGQWTKGKSLPGSTPLGPWLVPASDVDASNLRLQTLVNGEGPPGFQHLGHDLRPRHDRPPPQPVHGPGARRRDHHRHSRGRGTVRAFPLHPARRRGGTGD